MYLEIFLADFAVFRVFLGISRDFAEIPEFRGSATARNIRSPVLLKLILKKVKFLSTSMFRWRFLKKFLNVCFFWDEILLAGSPYFYLIATNDK